MKLGNPFSATFYEPDRQDANPGCKYNHRLYPYLWEYISCMKYKNFSNSSAFDLNLKQKIDNYVCAASFQTVHYLLTNIQSGLGKKKKKKQHFQMWHPDDSYLSS